MKKSLQKLSDSNSVEAIIKAKMSVGAKVYVRDFKGAIPKDVLDGIDHLEKTLERTEIDKFYETISPLLSEEARNSRWQNNHIKIKNAIHDLVYDFNRTPTVIEIARECKLSRQTVHKHLKEFSSNEMFGEDIKKYELLLPDLLGQLWKQGVNGWKPDTRALRLFWDILRFNQKTGKFTNTVIGNQQNYLQINNTILDQRTIQNLPKDSLREIEKIVFISLNKT